MLPSPIDLLEPGNIDLARLGPGTAFGIKSMLTGQPRMGTIKAVKRTHVLRLTQDSLDKVSHEIDKARENKKILFLAKIPLF